jgi:hypothetical protein
VAVAIAITLRAPIEVVAGGAFNVGSDAQNYTIGEVAERIARQVPTAKIVESPYFADSRNYRVAFRRIRERLGYEPQWSIDRGIAQVVSLVRSNAVGHYSLPAYSNVLCLQESGTSGFVRFKITGWEHELMNIDRITPSSSVDHPAVA